MLNAYHEFIWRVLFREVNPASDGADDTAEMWESKSLPFLLKPDTLISFWLFLCLYLLR